MGPFDGVRGAGDIRTGGVFEALPHGGAETTGVVAGFEAEGFGGPRDPFVVDLS